MSLKKAASSCLSSVAESFFPSHRVLTRIAATSANNKSGASASIASKPASPATRNVLLTCEHASLSLPPPLSWPSPDLPLVGQHWSYDIGSEQMVKEWMVAPSVVGVDRALLANYSRLFIDVNRPIGSNTMFRTQADQRDIRLNKGATEEELQQRIKTYYYPFHACLSSLIAERLPRVLMAVHSFTPVYEGQRRTCEIGVLYNRDMDRPLAEYISKLLCSHGLVSVINAPWSGRDGFMYTLDRAVDSLTPTVGAGVHCVMIEARQDLMVNSSWRNGVREIIDRGLKEYLDNVDNNKQP